MPAAKAEHRNDESSIVGEIRCAECFIFACLGRVTVVARPDEGRTYLPTYLPTYFARPPAARTYLPTYLPGAAAGRATYLPTKGGMRE